MELAQPMLEVAKETIPSFKEGNGLGDIGKVEPPWGKSADAIPDIKNSSDSQYDVKISEPIEVEYLDKENCDINAAEPKSDVHTSESIGIEHLGKENCDINEIELKGGAYKDIPSKEGYEKHHMPADSVTDIPFLDGPCIQMTTADHRQTASCGNSREAQEYRDMQKDLIDKGKFSEAFEMDVEDIREKFLDKYDDAIAQAEEYVDALKKGEKLS